MQQSLFFDLEVGMGRASLHSAIASRYSYCYISVDPNLS